MGPMLPTHQVMPGELPGLEVGQPTWTSRSGQAWGWSRDLAPSWPRLTLQQLGGGWGWPGQDGKEGAQKGRGLGWNPQSPPPPPRGRGRRPLTPGRGAEDLVEAGAQNSWDNQVPGGFTAPYTPTSCQSSQG